MASTDTSLDRIDTALSEDGLQMFVGYRLRRAWMAIHADLAETLRPVELRMITYTALVLIRDNPGLSQAQLAGLMGMERPNLVAIIEELSRRNLVSRNRARGDRRANALHLTEAGACLCTKATAAVTAHEARLTEGLGDSDRLVLETALARIRRNAGGE